MAADRWTLGLLLSAFPAVALAGDLAQDATAALHSALSAAESHLQAGDTAGAESGYHQAVFEGWLLFATLERLDGRHDEALLALQRGSPYAGEDTRALTSLAVAELRLGQHASAIEILTRAVGQDSKDPQALRLLAKALGSNGQIEAAAAALRRAEATGPDDPELTFVLATEYLWLKRIADAERLFGQLLELRPFAESRVLIGHAYRDAGEYARAIATLRAALEQKPGVRRAHYTLGTVILADPGSGPARLSLSIQEFEAELKLAPDDPLTLDQLGTALLDAGRPAEALASFERALALEARPLHAYHLGRSQLALDLTAEAAASSRRALELGQQQGASPAELERIHYQLGLALKKLGAAQEAAVHLAEAKRIAARWTDAPRPTEEPSAPSAEATPGNDTATLSLVDESPLAALPPDARLDLRHQVTAALTQAYLNLGVMQAQDRRFALATSLLETAAELDADFPRLQYALGIACFNAKQFEKAATALARAVALAPDDGGLKRMLAMASLETHDYAKAAALLRGDAARETDTSLQFAYGLALAHSGHEPEAETIFTELIAQQGPTPELNQALRELRSRR